MYFFQVQIAIFLYLQVHKTSYVYLQVQSLHTSTHSSFSYSQVPKISYVYYKYTKQAMYTWTIFPFSRDFILLSRQHLSISAISQLLLARFGPNLKQRVQGTYTTDYNCHHKICPGDICPYLQYLSCYRPDLIQILGPKFLGALIVVDKAPFDLNISRTKMFLVAKIIYFFNPNIFGS